MAKSAQIIVRMNDIPKILRQNIIDKYVPVNFLEIQGSNEHEVLFYINGHENNKMQLGSLGRYELDLRNKSYIHSLVFTQIDDKMTTDYTNDNPIALLINILHEGVEIEL